MARSYSQDLRDRVIDAGLGGMSARTAAAHYGIGPSTAARWISRAKEGDRTAHKQGKPQGSKLDFYHSYLLDLIQKTPDITLEEIRETLIQEHQQSAAVSTLWEWYDRARITFKKNSPRSGARTSGCSGEAPRVG